MGNVNQNRIHTYTFDGLNEYETKERHPVEVEIEAQKDTPGSRKRPREKEAFPPRKVLYIAGEEAPPLSTDNPYWNHALKRMGFFPGQIDQTKDETMFTVTTENVQQTYAKILQTHRGVEFDVLFVPVSALNGVDILHGKLLIRMSVCLFLSIVKPGGWVVFSELVATDSRPTDLRSRTFNCNLVRAGPEKKSNRARPHVGTEVAHPAPCSPVPRRGTKRPRLLVDG